jgi:hypothetical protein
MAKRFRAWSSLQPPRLAYPSGFPQENLSRRLDERAGLGDHATVDDHLTRHDPAHGGLAIIEQLQLEQKLVESHSILFHCVYPCRCGNRTGHRG